MNLIVQHTTPFFLLPRVRIYRRPLLIWIKFFGRSFFAARRALSERKDVT